MALQALNIMSFMIISQPPINIKGIFLQQTAVLLKAYLGAGQPQAHGCVLSELMCTGFIKACASRAQIKLFFGP